MNFQLTDYAKGRVLIFLLILSSLIGFLEWGKESKRFLFQIEGEIISKLFIDPVSVLHPFTVLPLAGQLLLVITLFQKKPNKIMTLIGIGGIGVLLGLMFVIGVISLNLKILFSTIPFLVLSLLTIRYQRISNT